jgi:hypothetical protein
MMKATKHGLTIGLERVGTLSYLSMKASGVLTHADYEIITPMIESALIGVTGPKIRVLFDMTELQGWELRAAWDDFKIGCKHGGEFAKVALYGNRPWQSLAAKVGSWFISGEVRYFEHEREALDWILE